MRLITKSDAKGLPKTLGAKDEFAEPKTFYVEKAKGNSVPSHFTKEENKDNKKITVNGEKTTLYRSKERSEYVAFTLGEGDAKQAYYVRDHSMLDSEDTNFVTYEKPVREKPVREPKEKKEKAAKPEDVVPMKKKNYLVTNVKDGSERTLTGKEFIAEFGLEEATAILNDRRKKKFTTTEFADGEGEPDSANAESQASAAGDTGAA